MNRGEVGLDAGAQGLVLAERRFGDSLLAQVVPNKLVGTVGIRRDPGTAAALSVKGTSNMCGIYIEEGGLIVGGDTSLPALPGGSGYTLVLDGSDRIRKLTSSIRYKHQVGDLPSVSDTVLLRPEAL